jgi:hypothetical protein
VRAAAARRSGLPLKKRIRNFTNNHLGRTFVRHSRDWAKAAARLRMFETRMTSSPHAGQYRVIRYEDVVDKPRQMAAQIFMFMDLPVTDEVLRDVEKAEVVGSSFYGPSQQEDAEKPNWSPTPRTEAFRPVNRWREWNLFERIVFDRLAGDELVELGYEPDHRWVRVP